MNETEDIFGPRVDPVETDGRGEDFKAAHLPTPEQLRVGMLLMGQQPTSEQIAAGKLVGGAIDPVERVRNRIHEVIAEAEARGL